MNICSHCRTQQPSNDITSCIECGYPIEQTSENAGLAASSDPLGFTVTEANGDDREFVGGQSGAERNDDDLGIESTTDLMEQEAHRDNSDPSVSPLASEPIGESAPPPPPSCYESGDNGTDDVDTQQACEVEDTQKNPDANGVKKLSDDEIKKIEQNLYGSNSYLKGQEKAELKDKLEGLVGNDVPQASEAPSESPASAAVSASAAPGPRMAASKKVRRSQSVALFWKNFIQVRGNQALITNDVMTINDREYVLKPKKLKSGYLIGGSAAVLVVFLIVLASLLTGDVVSGKGQLVGVVLDDYDQPYIEGATIRVPEFGKQSQSDGRGFFAIGELPTGTHEIQYVVDGEIIQVEYASITPGEIRMVFLRPSPLEEYTETESSPPPQAAAPAPRQTEPEPVVVKKEPAPAKTSSTRSSSSTNRKSTTSSYAKVTLDANVEGARFAIDGSVLGAGNLTYSRIKAGKHTYKVSADGYKSATGTFTLTGGQDRRLAVTLEPLAQQAKVAEYGTDDYFYSGKAALASGDYVTAVADFTRAIDAKPSYADAYFQRAEGYSRLKDAQKAHDDYIRAAEIYQIKKNYGRAITSYNGAIDCDRNSVTAYVGRGNALLNKGEVLAALADFDKSIYIDKRCFEAYYGLGEARFKQQQYSKAIKHFKDARSINDKDPAVHQYLMLCYLANNDIKNVKKAYDKFADMATDEQMNRFRSDQKYSAVLRVVDSQ